MGEEVSPCLFHVAMRNPRVDKFFAVRLVSQTRIKLQGGGLSVEQEAMDVSEVRGFFDSRDQQFANAKSPARPAYCHATDLGRRAAIPQYDTRGSDGLAVSQCNEMKRLAIIRIALQIKRNILFGDEYLLSDPKTLFDVLRRIRSSNCYHAGPGARRRLVES
jgi:hypothetical protein